MRNEVSICHLVIFQSKDLLHCLDEDIDGQTLVLLQQSDISQIFPRIKDRLKFVDRRKKLISTLNEPINNIDEPTNRPFNSTFSSSFDSGDSLVENDVLDPSVLSKTKEPNIEINLTTDSNLSSSIDCSDNNEDIYTKARLPVDYEGPDLTMRMQQYVDENNIPKFNPHTAMRGELLSLLFDQVTKSYHLL